MLYSGKQFARDQLFEDLLALRERLGEPKKWTKSWRSGQAVCLVAACETVTNHKIGPLRITQDNISEDDLRLGRMIYAVYTALYGPKASTSITLNTAINQIIRFNDSGVSTHEAVLLLLDRAIAGLFVHATSELLHQGPIEPSGM